MIRGGAGRPSGTIYKGVTMHRISKGALTALLIACASLAIGALFGVAQEGGAAPQVAPQPQALPTIDGTEQVGSNLTASRGTWTGTDPITYSYQWRRCNAAGNGCANIAGATAQTYLLRPGDAGHRLRVRVTARNGDGSNQATSLATAVVSRPTPTPAANGCPSGTGTINVSNLSPPARLNLDRYESSPSVIGRSTGSLTIRFHVSACNGRSVQGALLYAAAVPFGQFSIPGLTPTGADGWATAQMTQQRGFPAARQQQLLVVFGRAQKPGENVLGGISTRRLVSFPVNLGR